MLDGHQTDLWETNNGGVDRRRSLCPPSIHFDDEAAWRKAHPIATGVLDYFPDAMLAVSHCSFLGTNQHHKGEPLHWDKSKSIDEADALVRHLLQRGTLDSDGVRHSAKVAWRALALLQREIDSEKEDDSR